MCDRINAEDETMTHDQPFAGSAPAEAFCTIVTQYHCPRCDGAINPESGAVQSRVHPPQSTQVGLRKTVKVWCDHCREIFAAEFVLIGAGGWQIEDRPRLVTRKSDREAFLGRMEQIRGDRKVGAG